MVAVVRFQNRIPLPCAARSLVIASNSTGGASIHRIIANPPAVQRLEPSFFDQTIAIFRLVEIFCLVEANWSDQLRRSEISTVEIGADDRDPGQVGSPELGALEGSACQIGALQRSEFEIDARQVGAT